MSVRASALAGAMSLLLGACLVQPREASCAEATTCKQCRSATGCGWCDGEARCLEGTSLGPHDSDACAEGTWRFGSCSGTSDVRDCHTFESCGACVAESRCTWCALVAGAGHCTGTFCDSGTPAEADDECGTPRSCSDYGRCTRCASDPGCAWYDGIDTSFVTESDCDLVGLEDEPHCEPWP